MSEKDENNIFDKYKYGQNFMIQGSDHDLENYYDIIIDIDSIKKLFEEGWDVSYMETGENKYNQQKDKNLTVVAVIGNKNKGKSYILQKISGNTLPLGYSITTKGISILYPRNDIQNIILLDSAGFEVPLVQKDKVYDFEIKNENKKKEFEEKLEKIEINLKNAYDQKDKFKFDLYKKEKEELKSKKKSYIEFKELGSQIAEFTKDRRLTDYFLQKFILWNSDILLCVVGQLTFSDQKFINTIRSQVKNKKKKKLFIIHNLTTFVQKEQVEEYIKNTLLKSLTFDLEQIQIPKFGSKNEEENQYYWREKNISDNNNEDLDIIHLVMANDDSDAGKYYNDSTIDYIKRQIIAYVNYSKFDIINRIKDFIADVSNEIIDNKIEKDDIIIKGNKIKVNKIDVKDVKLKNCLTDELGTNSFVSSIYKPKYRRYKTKKNGEDLFVIEIEIPGGVENFKQTLEKKVGNNIITIRGEKKVIKMGTEKKNKETDKTNKETNKKNSFVLEIKVPLDQVKLNEFKKDSTIHENGIYKLFFSVIDDSSGSEEISLNEESDEDDDDDDEDDGDNDDDDDEKTDKDKTDNKDDDDSDDAD